MKKYIKQQIGVVLRKCAFQIGKTRKSIVNLYEKTLQLKFLFQNHEIYFDQVLRSQTITKNQVNKRFSASGNKKTSVSGSIVKMIEYFDLILSEFEFILVEHFKVKPGSISEDRQEFLSRLTANRFSMQTNNTNLTNNIVVLNEKQKEKGFMWIPFVFLTLVMILILGVCFYLNLESETNDLNQK